MKKSDGVAYPRDNSSMTARSLASATFSGCIRAIGCTLIDSLMMNSMRARPTPSLGRELTLKASSGLPRLIMICVDGRCTNSKLVRSTSNGMRLAIDFAAVAFSTGDGHWLAAFQYTRGVVCTHDRRDSQLTGHDRGMTSPPATIRNQSSGSLHDGFPVGCRRVRNQYFAGPKLGEMRDIGDDVHLASDDLLSTDRPAPAPAPNP